MDFKSFLNFDRMITPVIIKILFWIGLIMAAIGGIVTFFGGIIGGISDGSFGPVIGGFIGGPLVFILGALGARIYSELLIIIFQINESLTDIKYSLKKEEPPVE